jgi:hypothetical protein
MLEAGSELAISGVAVEKLVCLDIDFFNTHWPMQSLKGSAHSLRGPGV